MSKKIKDKSDSLIPKETAITGNEGEEFNNLVVSVIDELGKEEIPQLKREPEKISIADIESLGWVDLSQKNPDARYKTALFGLNVSFKKIKGYDGRYVGEYLIQFTEPNIFVIGKSEVPYRILFDGLIETKDELEKIMKQIQI